MAAGWGGKRRGAGRKPKLTTEIRELALEQAGGDAEYALGLVVGVMRDEEQPMDWRMAASLVVMDRVWGKPTQHNEDNVTVAGGVTIYLPDNGRADGRAEG